MFTPVTSRANFNQHLFPPGGQVGASLSADSGGQPRDAGFSHSRGGKRTRCGIRRRARARGRPPDDLAPDLLTAFPGRLFVSHTRRTRGLWPCNGHSTQAVSVLPELRDNDLVVVDGQQTRKRRASQTEYELDQGNFSPSEADGPILAQPRQGINATIVDQTAPEELMIPSFKPMFQSIPGLDYIFKMMSTIVSAFSGVGEKVSRIFYNDSYTIAERRAYNESGNVTNKRAKLSPPPFSDIRWITNRDPEFQNVERDSKQFYVNIDNVRYTGNMFCSQASKEAVQRLNRKLEPLTLSLVDNATELDAVRRGRWPDLAIMWLRGLKRICAYLGVMYHIPNLARLSERRGDRVPDVFKHELGPVFERNLNFTKMILSNPHFKQVLADVCTFWGLAYDGFPVSTVFLERILLDISAMGNDLPPPSFLVSSAYHQKLQAKFPPPTWAADDASVATNLRQRGDIPGMFPEKLVQTPPEQVSYLLDFAGDGDEATCWTEAERRAEDQLREATVAEIPTLPRSHVRSGRGTLGGQTAEQRSGRALHRSNTLPASRTRITKATNARSRFGTNTLANPRRPGVELQTTPERPHHDDFRHNSTLDHRSATALKSILRARSPRSPNRSPRLRQVRRRKSVRFADNVLSPNNRDHSGIDISRVDGSPPSPSPSPSPSPAAPPFIGYEPPNQFSIHASLEPTPEVTPEVTLDSTTKPPDEMEISPEIVDDAEVADLRGNFESMIFTDDEFPKTRRPYVPLQPPEELTEEEKRKRLMDLFSLPSPAGLRQSDDSKIAIELRKRKEAEEAAEAKRQAEERARKEAQERARREQEERLAKSGGLRLPNRMFVGPLSQEWTRRAQNTVRAGASTNLATTGEGVDLRRHDFAKVVPETEWLNDEIVNGSLNWLDRAINSAAGIKNVKTHTRKCLSLSSFFFKRLKDQGVAGTARTLSRNGVKKDNLLDVDTILLPICENMHWTLLVIRPSKRTVAHMDSLNPRGSSANTDLALAWMKEVLQEKFDPDEWKVVRHEAPRQTNGWDCGVHTITNGMCVSLGLSPFDCYSAADMPLQRLRIACVLLNGGFTGDFDLQVY